MTGLPRGPLNGRQKQPGQNPDDADHQLNQRESGGDLMILSTSPIPWQPATDRLTNFSEPYQTHSVLIPGGGKFAAQPKYRKTGSAREAYQMIIREDSERSLPAAPNPIQSALQQVDVACSSFNVNTHFRVREPSQLPEDRCPLPRDEALALSRADAAA